MRSSLYKKPKLRLHGIELRQLQFDLGETEVSELSKETMKKLGELEKTASSIVQVEDNSKPVKESHLEGPDHGYSLGDDEEEPPLMLTLENS